MSWSKKKKGKERGRRHRQKREDEKTIGFVFFTVVEVPWIFWIWQVMFFGGSVEAFLLEGSIPFQSCRRTNEDEKVVQSVYVCVLF